MGYLPLPKLLNLKYQAIADAEMELGNVEKIRSMFIGFQKFLYKRNLLYS
jgi:type I restriction enzyme R subunit